MTELPNRGELLSDMQEFIDAHTPAVAAKLLNTIPKVLAGNKFSRDILERFYSHQKDQWKPRQSTPDQPASVDVPQDHNVLPVSLSSVAPVENPPAAAPTPSALVEPPSPETKQVRRDWLHGPPRAPKGPAPRPRSTHPYL